MRVLAIISRDLEKPSTKYRIGQYVDVFKSRGIEFDFVNRSDIARVVNDIGTYDVVLNQKCLMRLTIARRIVETARRTIFDFDDAIYSRPGRAYSILTSIRVKRRLHYWLQHADMITTANRHLAGYARKFGCDPAIVPMALDLNAWPPVEHRQREGVVIGWTGSPANLPKINGLNTVLTKVVTNCRDVELRICCGSRPELSCMYTYQPYEPGIECAFVRELDIGLLPLPNDTHAAGKSPIKSLQYLACNVAVVASVVGATGEILNSQNSMSVDSELEWHDALMRLIEDDNLRSRMGQNGRRFVESHHDMRSVAKQLEAILRG